MFPALIILIVWTISELSGHPNFDRDAIVLLLVTVCFELGFLNAKVSRSYDGE